MLCICRVCYYLPSFGLLLGLLTMRPFLVYVHSFACICLIWFCFNNFIISYPHSKNVPPLSWCVIILSLYLWLLYLESFYHKNNINPFSRRRKIKIWSNVKYFLKDKTTQPFKTLVFNPFLPFPISQNFHLQQFSNSPTFFFSNLLQSLIKCLIQLQAIFPMKIKKHLTIIEYFSIKWMKGTECVTPF